MSRVKGKKDEEERKMKIGLVVYLTSVSNWLGINHLSTQFVRIRRYSDRSGNENPQEYEQQEEQQRSEINSGKLLIKKFPILFSAKIATKRIQTDWKVLSIDSEYRKIKKTCFSYRTAFVFALRCTKVCPKKLVKQIWLRLSIKLFELQVCLRLFYSYLLLYKTNTWVKVVIIIIPNVRGSLKRALK